MEIHIDLAVLLAAIIFFRLRRRTEARSKGDEMLTVAIVLVFGLLLAGTHTGNVLLGLVGELAGSIN
jgi:hypothetical protein